MTSVTISVSAGTNAESRIYDLFMELLERQFPLEPTSPIRLKTPNEFAEQLFIHVNHLNRTLRAAMGKTTSQLIGGCVAKEAAFMLKFTTCTITYISWGLGFDDPSSFTHFFRKHFSSSPGSFRKQVIV